MNIKIIKITLCIILYMICTINSYAVAVSDNDGAAFITKAEFDSLKNDFQAQIDIYNTSIDNKIDDAISSYLSGIKKTAEELIRPLVTNYTDIKWKNDLFMKINVRSFTNYNTYTDTTLKWQVPPFGEYRIVRAGRYYLGAQDYRDVNGKNFYFNFNSSTLQFKLDDGWMPSGEGTGNSTYKFGALLLICKNGENAPVIRTSEDCFKKETQMIDRGFPAIASYAGTNIGDPMYANFSSLASRGPDGGLIEVTKQTDDLLAFKVKFYNRNAFEADTYTYSGPYTSNIYRIKKSLSGYGQVEYGDINTDALPSTVWNNNNLGTFNTPVYYVQAASANQRVKDIDTLKVMFLGNDTNTKVNCAIRNDVRLFSPWDEYNFKDSEIGSILCDTGTGANIGSDGTGFENFFPFLNASGATINARLSLPLWPKYFLKNLVNPDFVVDGNGLAIGGGIPIASNILSKGVLNIKLKHEVGTDDLTNTTVSSQGIYMSFKKSNYNDTTTNNYYKDENNNELKDVLFEPATANQTYEINIPVEVGDSVWFRMGPKERNASGLFAKITDMQVKLVIE